MPWKLLSRSPTDTLIALADWAEGQPKWLRHGLLGAAFVYAFALSRSGLFGLLILLAMFVTGHASEAWRLLFVVLLLAPAWGFTGGLLYSVCEPLAQHLGVVGRFLQRVAGGFGYALILVYAVLPLIPDSRRRPSTTDSPSANIVVVTILSLLIGLALSVSDTRPDGGKAETNWRFVGGVVLTGAFLALLMYLAGWTQ